MIALPWAKLRVSSPLWFPHCLSRWRVKPLLLAAVAAPGPSTSSLPRRVEACPRTPHTDRVRRRKPKSFLFILPLRIYLLVSDFSVTLTISPGHPNVYLIPYQADMVSY